MNHGRRDRSRSPMFERRSDSKTEGRELQTTALVNMNHMMLNNMFQPGNMMMAGMFPNMMMPSAMMGGGIMPTTNMEMMSNTGMEIIPQQTVDIAQTMTPIAGQNIASITGSALNPMTAQTMSTSTSSPMDINVMGGMMIDPTTMGMNVYGSMATDMVVPIQEKKEIVLKHCTLTPNDSNHTDQPKRTKPPGCRTIFVGGLPDKIRETVVREIFERYGRIQTLRLSKKHFCHIRYDKESSVDSAMQLSGYCIKITDKEGEENEDSPAYNHTGWLHVDYALSRDDQNEYERRQRHILRAQEAQMQQLSAQQGYSASVSNGSTISQPLRQRSPSPLRILPFSSGAISQLVKKMKSDEYFSSTIPTLISWLERGECSKKNFLQFYSMIQATNSHVHRLFNEKMKAEEEFQQFKEQVKQRIEAVLEQLEQVGRVFSAAMHQRVWDHFTKPQRKNIETWHKMTQDFTNMKEEFLEKFNNDDNEYNIPNYNIGSSVNEDILKRENESLQFQLEAYKNEVDVIKAESKKEMEKFKAQFIARQALGNLDSKNPLLPSPLVKPPPPPPLPEELDAKVHIKEAVDAGCGEAKLIGVMSAFLQVHPQGASLDYVVSYVRALFPHVSQATVHHVLQKHEDVFERTTSGVGANIENRWTFVAFKQQMT